MKRPCPFPQGSHGAVSRVTLVALVLLPFLPLNAATLTWDADGTAGGATGGTGTWNTSAVLWNNAGTMQAWNNLANDLALFGGTAGTVTLGSPVTVVGMTFNSSGYTIAGAGNTLTLGGSVNVTTAEHTALINSAISFSAATNFGGAGNLTLHVGSTVAGANF